MLITSLLNVELELTDILLEPFLLELQVRLFCLSIA